MFWSDYSSGSAVLGGHLDRDDFTLSDLLEHDDIIQECRSQNKKLVEFLVLRGTIKELIALIVRPEPPRSEDAGAQAASPGDAADTSYRRPTLACEIITSGLPGLVERITSDAQLLADLFEFLDAPAPLNPLRASFFSKTFQVFFSRQYGQDWYTYQMSCLHVLDFAKGRADFLRQLLRHVGTSAIADTIQCVMRVDIEEMRRDFLNWLDSQKFIERLVGIVCGKSDCPPMVSAENQEAASETNDETTAPSSEESFDRRIVRDRSENAAKLLCDLVVKGREAAEDCSTVNKTDPLLKTCTTPSTVDLLLSSMFSSDDDIREWVIINGVQVLLTLLNDAPGLNKPPAVDQDEIQPIAEAVLPYLPKFKEIIAQSPPQFVYGYSNSIEKPVGAVRLAVIHLFEVLLHWDTATALTQSQVLPVLLDMFVEYKWNNFLHAHVMNIVKLMFARTDFKDVYSKHLFDDCKLLEFIVSAWNENDQVQALKKPRNGYMGHLIQIANDAQNYLETFPDVLENVPEKTKEEWNSLASTKLEEINKVQNTYLGGKHPTQSNNSDQMLHQGYDSLKIHEVSYGDDDDDDLPKHLDAQGMCLYSMNKFPLNRDEFTEVSTELDLIQKLMSEKSMDDFNKMIRGEFYEEANYDSKNLDESSLYGLATKLSSCEGLNSPFSQWTKGKYGNWDDSDEIDLTTSSFTFTNSNPWETNDPNANASAEWADFASFDNANNSTSNFTNAKTDSHSTNPFLSGGGGDGGGSSGSCEFPSNNANVVAEGVGGGAFPRAQIAELPSTSRAADEHDQIAARNSIEGAAAPDCEKIGENNEAVGESVPKEDGEAVHDNEHSNEVTEVPVHDENALNNLMEKMSLTVTPSSPVSLDESQKPEEKASINDTSSDALQGSSKDDARIIPITNEPPKTSE